MKHIILIFLLLAGLANAKTFYMSFSRGNDANDGKSWSNPIKTIDVLDDSMAIGDTALFGAGIWYNSQLDPPHGGHPDSITVYACSSWAEATIAAKLSGKHLAKIYGGDTISTLWTIHDTTTPADYDSVWDPSIQDDVAKPTDEPIWKTNWAGSNCYYDAKCYTLSHGDSLLIPQTELSKVDQLGEFFHSTAGVGTLYACLYNGDNPNDETMIASCQIVLDMETGSGSTTWSHFKFWGLEFGYGKQGTVWISRADSCYFEHCHIHSCGYVNHLNPSCIFSHAADAHSYFNHFVACSLGWAVNESNNLSATNILQPWGGFDHGGAFLTYSQENCYVESCYVYGFSSIGVGFKGGNSGLAPYSNNVVRYSTILNCLAAVDFYAYPDHDSAYGNILSGRAQCVAMKTGGQTEPELHPYRLFICNNTLYDAYNIFMGPIGATSADTCGDSNYVKYNISYKYRNWETGNISGENYFMGFESAPDNCEGSFTIDSNYWYDSTNSFYTLDCNGSNGGFSVWQACGFGANSDTINIPLIDPANGNFGIIADSADNWDWDIPIVYGGRTWYGPGADQTAWETTTTKRLRLRK